MNKLLRQGIPVAFRSGDMSSDRISLYFNNTKLAVLGSGDPRLPANNREIVVDLPGNITAHNALYIVLEMKRYWRSHGLREIPRIGIAANMYHNYYRGILVSFIFVIIAVIISLYYIVRGIIHSTGSYNLYFGVYSLSIALFLSSNLDIREFFFGDNILLRSRIDHISVETAIASFILFIDQFFRNRISRFTKILAVILTARYKRKMAEEPLIAGVPAPELQQEGAAALDREFIRSFCLTRREEEILGLLMNGASRKEIADALGVTPKTVKNHIYNMYQKMGVHSHREILAKFSRFSSGGA
ncbi:MAG: helix-turn-helix transcriptional regulator [bacterium]|nr:helix-turn-helix transcriptional regulator [bacterium]